LTHCNISDNTLGAEALILVGLERLDMLNLSDNKLGFKTGSLILKNVIEREGNTAQILLQFNKISELLINSINEVT